MSFFSKKEKEKFLNKNRGSIVGRALFFSREKEKKRKSPKN